MGIDSINVKAPFIGLTWKFDESQRRTAQRVINFLSDRRILNSHRGRSESQIRHCMRSAQDCRARLGAELDQARPGSDLERWLLILRSAFTQFYDAGGDDEGDTYRGCPGLFLDELEELRLTVTAGAEVIGARYKLHGLSDYA